MGEPPDHGNIRAVSLMAQDPDLGPRLPKLLKTWHAARQRHEEQAPQREFAVIRACSGDISICAPGARCGFKAVRR